MIAVFILCINRKEIIMETRLKKWGNGTGLLLKKELLQEIGAAIGDVLDVQVKNGTIVLTPKFRHRSLKERAAEYGGELNLISEIDWGEPTGSEVW